MCKPTLYQCGDFFVARTATQPSKFLEEFYLADDPKKYLTDFYGSSTAFQESILLASPSLYEALVREKSEGEYSDATIDALFSYFNRSTMRPTPFGMFAFVSEGRWSDQWRCEFTSKNLQKKCRPDVEWMLKAHDDLLKSLHSSDLGSVVSNPALQQRIDEITLITKANTGTTTCSLKISPLLEKILQLTSSPIDTEELLHILSTKFRYDSEKTRRVIFTLVKKKILLTSVELQLLIDSPQENLMALNHNVSVKNRISQYQKSPIGGGLSELKNFYAELQQESAIKTPLHVDLHSAQEYSLPKIVAHELEAAASVLWEITPKHCTALDEYYQRFLEKYGISRLVSLEELVNETKGLGFPPHYHREIEDEIEPHPAMQTWFYKKWAETVRSGTTEILLDDRDIQGLSIHKDRLSAPLSFDFFFSLNATSRDSVDKGEFALTLHPITTKMSGCSSMGRFWDYFSVRTQEKIKQFQKNVFHLDPQKEFSEIAYCPNYIRAGNVMIHSPMTENVIEYADKNIYIGADATGLYLTREEGGRPLFIDSYDVVNPSLAPMHVRLLRDISKCNQQTIYPFYAELFEHLPFIPRVRFGRIIFSPAIWHLSYEHIGGAVNDSFSNIKEKMISWMIKWKVPRRFFVTKGGDQRIFIDQGSNFSAKYLVKMLMRSKKKSLIIAEADPHAYYASSDQGCHQVEFVVPIRKNQIYKSKEKIYLGKVDKGEKRWEYPLGEWLNLHLYLPEKNHILFLTQSISPLLCKVSSDISNWFFVRYRDCNGAHMRLRLHKTNDSSMPVIQKWVEDCMEEGYISECKISSYERELERYGGEKTLKVVDDFFTADSNLVVALHNFFKHNSINYPIEIVGVFTIFHFFHSYGFSLERQSTFLEDLQLNQSLLTGFRSVKQNLTHDLQLFFEQKSSFFLAPLYSLFSERRERIAYLVPYLNELSNAEFTIQSLLHMHCNRFLGMDTQLEEKAFVFLEKAIQVLLKKTSLAIL